MRTDSSQGTIAPSEAEPLAWICGVLLRPATVHKSRDGFTVRDTIAAGAFDSTIGRFHNVPIAPLFLAWRLAPVGDVRSLQLDESGALKFVAALADSPYGVEAARAIGGDGFALPVEPRFSRSQIKFNGPCARTIVDAGILTRIILCAPTSDKGRECYGQIFREKPQVVPAPRFPRIPGMEAPP